MICSIDFQVKDESPLIEEIAIKVKNCNLFTGCLPNAEVSPNDEVMNQGNPIFKWKKAHLNIERLTDLSNTSHKQPDMNVCWCRFCLYKGGSFSFSLDTHTHIDLNIIDSYLHSLG
jgi:hypothetical protein